MEEYVGKLWHRLITRAADTHHAEAMVALDDMKHTVGVLFRALGGDGGLRVEVAEAAEHGARRSWLQRIAGSNRSAELAWRDEETLRLPPQIALFEERSLNRDLYLWLAALAAADHGDDLPAAWLARNQTMTQRTLKRFPGMQSRYQRLVRAQLALRPAINDLPEDEAAQETIIQQSLREPGSVEQLPLAKRPPQPVFLWLHPSPPGRGPAMQFGNSDPDMDGIDGQSRDTELERKQAERVDSPEEKDGLVTIRMENIFTWGEYAKVDRTTDEDDSDDVEQVADDMEVVSTTRDNKTTASRLRFDLDLPSAEYDDLPIGEGILLPEWHYRKGIMQPDHCLIQPMVARDAEDQELPTHLRRMAKRIRSQFEVMVQSRTWYRSQPDGSEIDLDAFLDFHTERHHGRVNADQGLYRDFRSGNRDMACLLLADLSLSTDAAVNNDARVIDVIRDSLYLFSEALSASGDRFALYGFSSRNRNHVRVHTLKSFDDPYNAKARGRIQAIKPGYYTRMGAAIRYASQQLAPQGASKQLLLILTDGKPNDLDQYEGRYGVEDTRMAIHEARQMGLFPFCVTIDKKAGDYLPHLFGPGAYVVIRKPGDLPRQLPLLYANLTL